MKRRTIWLILSCLIAALVLASCAPAVTEEKEEEAAEVAPVKEPQYGGTLTVLTAHASINPLSWDPADFAWFTNHSVSPYQEQLLVGDLSKGKGGTGEFWFVDNEYIPYSVAKGQLCESFEFPDPLTLVFHIRKGVMWQDKPGVMAAREFTADDVLFTFNRTMASEKAFTDHYDWVESVSAPDKYTFVIKMKTFWANWQSTIGWGYYHNIYPSEQVEAGIADWKNACGTGPFMITDYVTGSQQVYERNPNYWDKITIGGKEYQLPFVDKIVWPIIVEEPTRIAALRTAKCDVLEACDWKYVEDLEETNPELQRLKYLSTGTANVAVRVDTPPFDDLRVRRALNMGIDKQGIIDSWYGGNALMLSFPFSILWGEDVYTPLEELPESARELFEHNPEKAKQLLAEAGFPDGFKAKMVCHNIPTTLDLMSMVVGYWDEINVECEIEPIEYGAYYSTMMGKKFDQMIYFGKGNANPFRIFKTIALPNQAWNPSCFDDDYLTEKWYEAARNPNIEEQNEILKELNVYLIDQTPYIYLPCPYVYEYAQPWVKNWYGEINVNARAPGLIHATYWIDQAEKEAMGY